MLVTKLLICPSHREAVGFLSHAAPLSNVLLLGQGLLEYWVSALACSGVKRIIILAHDRPEQVQALAGTGERWGLELKIVAESRELTPAQALLKYGAEFGPVPEPDAISVLDHFPGLPQYPLFGDYRGWFEALCHWMPHAITPDRVGTHEMHPRVWVGTDSNISPQAQLHAPCWIGRHVFVGARTVVGPRAIVEDGAFLEPEAEVSHSVIGPDTFVGKLARIVDSVAWGDMLINWRSGSLTKVPDPFLLCALRQQRKSRTAGWLARLAELYARNREGCRGDVESPVTPQGGVVS